MVGLESAGDFPHDARHRLGVLLAVERGVEVDALASARHRHRIEPHPGEDPPRETSDLGALRQTGTLTGVAVEVEHEPVGVAHEPGPAELPLRHLQLEGGGLGQPGESRPVIDQRVLGDTFAVRYPSALHPVGRAGVEVLLEERGRRMLPCADPVHPALARHRPTRRVGDQHVGDLRVIVEHVGFRRAGFGVGDLVEVGEADAAAVHGDDCRRRPDGLDSGHGSSSPGARPRATPLTVRSGAARGSTRRIRVAQWCTCERSGAARSPLASSTCR